MPFHEKAGAKGERLICEHFSKMKNCLAVKEQIRINNPNPKYKYTRGEIDVLAIMKKGILLVEVKHYSGIISLQNGELFQNGESRNWSISRMLKRVEWISEVLRYKKDLQNIKVIPMLVFSADSTKFSGEMKSNDNILICTKEDITSTVNDRLEKLEQINNNQLKQVNAIIEKYGTWDKVSWDGGKVISGDIVNTNMPLDLERKEIHSVHIKRARSWLMTFFKGPLLSATFTSWEGEKTTKNIPSGQNFVIRRPGLNQTNEEIKLDNVKSIVFGYNGIEDWKKWMMKQIEGKKASERVTENQEIKGTVIKWIESGLLVHLGIRLHGLIHISRMDEEKLDMLKSVYRKNTPITVKVIKIRNNDKISLSFLNE